MKFYSGLLGAVLASVLFLEAQCGPAFIRATDEDLAAQGYTIQPMTYTGPVTVGGDNMTFTGTMEEVHAQILKLNPNYDQEFQHGDDTEVHFHKREPVQRNLKCNMPIYPNAVRDIVNRGVGYLTKHGGDCHVGAGPKVCSRISCSYNSAIFFCNDNNHPFSHPCAHLGGYYAKAIADLCGLDDQMNGQLFDTDNFNVLVKYSRC